MQPGFYSSHDPSANDNDHPLPSIVDPSNQDLLLSYFRDSDQFQTFGNGLNASYLSYGTDFTPNFSLPTEFSRLQSQQAQLSSAPFLKPTTKNGAENWMMTSYQNNQPTMPEETEAKKPGKNTNTKKNKAKTEAATKIETESVDPSDFKLNSKNTYINKIQTLFNESEMKDIPPMVKNTKAALKESPLKENLKGAESKSMMKKVKSCERFVSPEEGKFHEKLAKNRESARNSRKRKKVYIELLEKKVEELSQELFSARKQLEANKNNENQAMTETKLVSQMQTGKQQLFDRLEKLVQKEADETEMSLLIDSLRLRMGASGKDRIQLVDYFYKQAIDQLLPIHMKYLLWAASEGKDVFGGGQDMKSEGKSDKSSTPDYWSELLLSLNLSESQKKYILKYRKKLLQEKSRIEDLVHSLNQTRMNLLQESVSLESVIDDLRNSLSSDQIARFLIALNKERYRKEFSAERLWQFAGAKEEENFDEEEDDGDSGSVSGGPNLDYSSESETPVLKQPKKDQNRAGHENHSTANSTSVDYEFFRNLEIDPFRKKVHIESDE